jgi:RHS repeat-associated protein
VLSSGGAISQRFVYGTKPNVPDYIVASGTSYRVISDERGSVRLVVNASTGAIVQQIEYDEFGNVLSDSSPGFQPFGFAGCLYDGATQLCHFLARDYDAQIGRWLSKVLSNSVAATPISMDTLFKTPLIKSILLV